MISYIDIRLIDINERSRYYVPSHQTLVPITIS